MGRDVLTKRLYPPVPEDFLERSFADLKFMATARVRKIPHERSIIPDMLLIILQVQFFIESCIIALKEVFPKANEEDVSALLYLFNRLLAKHQKDTRSRPPAAKNGAEGLTEELDKKYFTTITIAIINKITPNHKPHLTGLLENVQPRTVALQR
jgi:hypothetical protein